MEEFSFKYCKPDDIACVSQLVWEVFTEFVGAGYSEEGVETFRQFIQPEELGKSLDSGEFFIVCCWKDGKIAGVIAVKDCFHISLLFVQKEFHKKGIARELLRFAMEECKKSKPEIDELTVNSSPYAKGIYERLGFTSTGPEQTQNGITYIPMRMALQIS